MARVSAARGAPRKSTSSNERSAKDLPRLDIKATEYGILGRIKWYNPNKEYGFVVCSGFPEDIFLHKAVLKQTGLNYIAEGRPVYVSFGRGPKGFAATTLTLADK